MAKCNAKKERAAELFKLGQYGDAVKAYHAAAEVLEAAAEDFPLFLTEVRQVEATVYNNLAACAKKDTNTRLEIDYTTKVIERQEHLSEKSVLLKAYLRRGLAYEESEKYLQAKEDMLSVKELQAENK